MRTAAIAVTSSGSELAIAANTVPTADCDSGVSSTRADAASPTM